MATTWWSSAPDRPGPRSPARLSEDPDVACCCSKPDPTTRPRARPAGVRSAELLPRVDRAGPDLAGPRRDARRRRSPKRCTSAAGAPVARRRSTRMCAIRGTVDDYERWADELGCAGWGWPEMLDGVPARSRTTSTTAATACTARAARSRSPALPLDALPPLDRALRAAIDRPRLPDRATTTTAGTRRASAACALTLRDGRRVSTNDAYLEPARGRPNLDVRGDVLVDRVLLDGQPRASACGSRRARRSRPAR